MQAPTRAPRSLVLLAALGLAASPALGQLAFVDIAPAKGVVGFSFGRGAGMADLDQDGLLDLVAFDDLEPSSIYRQFPAGSFTEVSAAWGIPFDTNNTWGGLIADFDNDGDDDIYEFNGGFYPPGQPNQLFRNDLGTLGTFTDVSLGGGDITRSEQNFGATAVDYDRDGVLDIFQSTAGVGTPCALLRNLGGLKFLDVAPAAGITKTADFRHCGSGDIDNDGWIELGAGQIGTSITLYHNQGDGTFVDIAAAAGLRTPGDSFGALFTDVDNDGLMDLVIPKYQIGAAKTTTQLYLNNGDLTFANVSGQSGLSGQQDMGHDIGDLDADGFPELYIGTGTPTVTNPDFLFSIVPGGPAGIRALDISVASGIRASGDTRLHGMAFGDLDGDGDIDIYANNGGPSSQPSTKQGNFLWENQGNANNWVGLRLVGVLSNRSAVGTRSVATTSTGRAVHRYLSIGRGFGNSPDVEQHFGIGTDAGVSRIDITWPSGVRQVVLQPAPRTRRTVVETGMRLVGTPTLGSAVTIECCGPAGERLCVWTALGAASVTLPQFGGLLELASPLVPLGSAVLDAAGRFDLSFVIPSDPLLSGVTVYTQAWVRPPGTTSGGTLTRALSITVN